MTQPSPSGKKLKTHRCSGNGATSEVLCLLDIFSTSIGNCLNALLPLCDRRICLLLYLRTKLSHSVIRTTSGPRSPSLSNVAEGQSHPLGNTLYPTQGKEGETEGKTTQTHIHELQTQRVQLHPLCALPSRALPGPLLASVVGLLRVQRLWCPPLGQRHLASAVEPVNKIQKHALQHTTSAWRFHGAIRDSRRTSAMRAASLAAIRACVA